MKVIRAVRKYRLLVVFSTLFLAACGSCRSEHHVSRPQVTSNPVNAAFLELVSLSALPNGSYKIPISDSDGKTWYRESDPGLDISYLDLSKTQVTRTAQGPAILLIVRAEYRDRVYAWTKQRVGRQVGFQIEGRVRAALPLNSALAGEFMLDGFASTDEAEKLLARIKSGS